MPGNSTDIKISITSDFKAQGFDDANKNMSKLDGVTSNLTSGFKTLLGVSAALGAISVFKNMASEAIEMADTYKLADARLTLVTDNTLEFVSAQQALFKISQDSHQSYMATVDLYSRIARSTKDLGKSQTDMLTVTEAINKSFIISGAATESSQAAIIQLGQAFASGTLRGDELNSVLEQSPRLAEAIAKGMGKTVGELRSLGAEGKLTSEQVFDAIVNQVGSINEEFNKMPKTVSQATTQMGNSLTMLTGYFDKTIGATSSLSNAISSISSKIDEFRRESEVASTSVFQQTTVDDITRKANQIADEIAKLKTNLKEDDGWLWFGLDDRTAGEYENKIKRLEQQMEQLGQTAVNVLWNTNEATKKAAPLTADEVKKRLDKSLKEYISYYEAIGDKTTAWALKEQEIIEKYSDSSLDKSQINAILQSEQNKYLELDKIDKEWAKRKLDLTKELTIAEQDEFAKPYIELTSKYEEDLVHFKGNKEAQLLLTQTYNASVQKLNEETAKKSDEKEKERLEKEIKLFEDSYQKRTDSYKTYYEAIGDDTNAWYMDESEKLEKLAKAGVLSNEQMLQVWSKDWEKFQDEQFKENNKWLYDFFENMNKALDNQLLDGFKRKFKSFADWLENLFESIGDSILASLSRSIAGSLTSSLEGGIVNIFKTYGGSGATTAAASLVGTTISASDVSELMNNGGTYDSAANTITTAGGTAVKLAEDGSGTVTSSGSDILSIASTISSIKTAYDLMTVGITGSIISGFQTASGMLATIGAESAATSLMSFGVGVANPFAYAGVSGLPTAMTIGSSVSAGLIGAGVGYGVGWLGDKLFGADTYAGITGAVGGALGGIGASLGLWGGPVGILVGSVLGSVLGGIFGKTKVTGSGIDILGNATAEEADGRYYTSYKKKSWFSSKSWTTYTGFTDEEIAAIEKTIGAYDYMLGKLGEYNDLVVAGGRFANLQEFLDTNVVKAFLTAINPNDLDTIYQSWVDYAKEIDTTIAEAISTVVSGYITDKRDYEEWLLGDGTLKQLSFTSSYLKSDFEALSETLGASGVTIDNFLSMYDAAIKANFTQETITAWQNLGDALTASTDAAKAYQEALDKMNANSTSYRQSYTEWLLGSGTTEQLSYTSGYLKSNFEALASSLGASGVTVDNFLSMYDAAIKADFTEETITAWQNLGNALMDSTDAAKAYQDALDELNDSTTYSLNSDMMLNNLNQTTEQVNLKSLISTQNDQNESIKSILFESLKSLKQLLKYEQMRITQ